MIDADTRSSLEEIGMRFGSDKFVNHRFAEPYQRHFHALRDSDITILEIGIGEEDRFLGGASLLTWKEYFTSAQIIGIDIYDKSSLDQERIHTVICDQSNPDQLRSLCDRFGPFDVVIDDGSHVGHHVTTALFHLFPNLRAGGLYVIEDIQTSYWSKYGGSSIAPMCYDTSMRWLKFCLDIVNADEILQNDYFPLDSSIKLSEVHVYHNIAFLQKLSVEDDIRSRVLDTDTRRVFVELDNHINGSKRDVHQSIAADPLKLGRLMEIVSDFGGVDEFLRVFERFKGVK